MDFGRKTISYLRSALATALVVWCAGAGCMMVSYARGAAMSAAAAESKSADFDHASGLAAAHSCCKARHASERRMASAANHSSSTDTADLEELSKGQSSSDAISCCPLTSGTFVVSARQSIGNENSSALPGAGADSIVSSAAVDSPAMPLRLPNQNQTYLRCCVFLI